MRRRQLRPERTPLYNPQFLPPDTVEHLFTAHTSLLERVSADLRDADPTHTPPHKLVVGPPGSGKTMFLRRLALAIASSEVLGPRHYVLEFPEELFGIATLQDFEAEAVARLKGQLPPAQRAALAAETVSPGLQGMALGALVNAAVRGGRRVVLLVDHLDRALERLAGPQSWALREVITGPHLCVIGTSTTPIASAVDFGRAFYDPFQVHVLRPLTDKVAVELLAKLLYGQEGQALEPSLAAIVRTILLLSGGQVRTLMILRRAIGDRRRWTVGDLVEYLLDHYTPRYRAQLETLSAQSQHVLALVAWAWHPVRASEIAAQTSGSTRAASDALDRLVRADLVMKVSLGPSKVAYHLADRLLNAWLAMRRGGGQRNRLRKFLILAEEAIQTAEPWEIPRLQRALVKLKPDSDAANDVLAPELRRLVELGSGNS